MFDLPNEIKSKIFEFDSTYRDEYKKVINQLVSPRQKSILDFLNRNNHLVLKVIEISNIVFHVYYNDHIKVLHLMKEDENDEKFINAFYLQEETMYYLENIDMWVFCKGWMDLD